MKNLKSVVVALALSAVLSVSASASTIERTVSPSGHVIDSFMMMCRVVDIKRESDCYVVFVEDNSGNVWSFLDGEDYWKKGDKMTCVFDYCEDCETLELNEVVE